MHIFEFLNSPYNICNFLLIYIYPISLKLILIIYLKILKIIVNNLNENLT